MNLKYCNCCKLFKNLSEFHKHPISKDGLKSECKICRNKKEKEARFHPHRRAVQMWHDMNKRVKNQQEYSHVKILINYSEFISWAEKELVIFWIKFGKKIKASIDRIDSNKNYEFGNIRIIPLTINVRRSRIKRILNNKD